MSETTRVCEYCGGPLEESIMGGEFFCFNNGTCRLFGKEQSGRPNHPAPESSQEAGSANYIIALQRIIETLCHEERTALPPTVWDHAPHHAAMAEPIIAARAAAREREGGR